MDGGFYETKTNFALFAGSGAASGAGDARQPVFEPVGSDAGGAEGTVKLRGDQRTTSGLFPEQQTRK